MERQLIGSYQNGNYTVSIYDDGTKVRETQDGFWLPKFPESIDLSITNRCSRLCPACYQGCTPDGEHADLDDLRFLDTLAPYTELAVNGNQLDHPQLDAFLQRMYHRGVIVNITVHIGDFIEQEEKLRMWQNCGLIHGVGVSVDTSLNLEWLSRAANFPNVVFHVIAGIATPAVFRAIAESGAYTRILVLGYKTLGRGADFWDRKNDDIARNMNWLSDNLRKISKMFNILSFDNLGIEQLRLKEKMKPEAWKNFYMGDDGQFTMYIDGVVREFASSSVSTGRYPLCDDIQDMFYDIRKELRND